MAGGPEMAEYRLAMARGLAAASLLCLCLCLCMGRPALAQQAGPRGPISGKDLALAVCVPCHQVAAAQDVPPRANSGAPRFADVANRPNMNPDELRRFLRTTHRSIEKPYTMPDLMLTEGEIAKLVDYIANLRTTPR